MSSDWSRLQRSSLSAPSPRDVRAWATLMVLVVTLYGYRFERHDLGRRIMRALAPTKGRTRDADSGGYRREQRRADQGRRSVSGSVWISCGSRTASTPPNGTTRGAFVRIDRVVTGSIALDNAAAWVNEGDLGSSLLGISLLERLRGVEIRNDTLTFRR
jgi:predicted aspartyl protease